MSRGWQLAKGLVNLVKCLMGMGDNEYESIVRKHSVYILSHASSDPGEYFAVDQFTGRVFNTKAIVPSDPNWAGGYVTISVKVSKTEASRTGGWCNQKGCSTK
jgi:hypothetical protein